jgi:hypothetical protein
MCLKPNAMKNYDWKIFAVCVENRNAQTLSNIIAENILPGFFYFYF